MFRPSRKLACNITKFANLAKPGWTASNGFISLRSVHLTSSLATQSTDSSKYRLCDLSMKYWPDVVQDLTDYAKQYDPIIVPKRFARYLDYNIPPGKHMLPRSLISAYKVLTKREDLTEENLKLVDIMGWCTEMYSTLFTVTDDLLDGDELRRGKKCWYKLEDVGLEVINDAMMMEMGYYYLLKKYFRKKEYYNELVDLFHNQTFITTVGQCLILRFTSADVTTFTMENYKSIASYKAAYLMCLPILAAMHMAGIKDPELFNLARNIQYEIGMLYIIQNDFLGCFGDVGVSGKIDTDIKKGRITWLAVTAIKKADNEQKQIIKECYGKDDPEKENRIKKLFEDLEIPQDYKISLEKKSKAITSLIEQLPPELPLNPVFTTYLDMILSYELAS